MSSAGSSESGPSSLGHLDSAYGSLQPSSLNSPALGFSEPFDSLQNSVKAAGYPDYHFGSVTAASSSSNSLDSFMNGELANGDQHRYVSSADNITDKSPSFEDDSPLLDQIEADQMNSFPLHVGDGRDSPVDEGESPVAMPAYDQYHVKHRRRTTAPQLRILEQHFAVNTKPDIPLRKTLAEQLNMTPREVQVWFQNRRAKAKRLDRKAPIPASTPRHPSIIRQSGGYPDVSESLWQEGQRKTPPSAPSPGYLASRRATVAGLPHGAHALSRPPIPHVPLLPDHLRKMSLPMLPSTGPLAFPVRSAPTSAPLSNPFPLREQFFPGTYHHTQSHQPVLTHLTIPTTLPPTQIHSAPAEQSFNRPFWQEAPTADTAAGLPSFSPLEDSQEVLHHEGPGANQKADVESEFDHFMAQHKFRNERADSTATNSSYDVSTVSGGQTTPNSVTSGFSFNTAMTSPGQDFPPGFDPNTRRASCPAEFVASFGMMLQPPSLVGNAINQSTPTPASVAQMTAFAQYHGSPVFAQDTYQQQHPARHPSFDHSAFPMVPSHLSHGRPSSQSYFPHHALPNYAYDQTRTHLTPPGDHAARRLSLASNLDPIAEQPYLHYMPMPMHYTEAEGQETAQPNESSSMTAVQHARKARSQGAIREASERSVC